MNGEGSAGPPNSPVKLSLERGTFDERVSRLVKHWSKHGSSWNGADALVFVFGAADDSSYNKSLAMQFHLFGCQLHNVVMLLLPNALHVLASEDVCQALQSFVSPESNVKLELIRRDAANGDKEGLEKLMGMIRVVAKGEDGEAKSKVGLLSKEKAEGPLADRWAAALEQEGEKVEVVDVTPAVATQLAIKDEAAASHMDFAAKVTSKIFKKALISRIEDIIDEDDTIKHDALAEEVEAVIKDPSKAGLKFPAENLESCYFPIVESGGDYDIRASATSNSNSLKHDVIIVSMGVSYKGYCTNLARTILVDPPKKVQEAYKALTGAYEATIGALKHGEPLRGVYEACRAYLERKHPSYVQYLPKSLGSSIGVEFRDPQHVINAKATAVVKANMYFNLAVGFQNIPLTPQERKQCKKGAPAGQLERFSLLLADTVAVPEMASAGVDEKLKTSNDYQISKVMWEVGEEEGSGGDDEGEDGGEGRKERKGPSAGQNNILSNRLRERRKEDKDGLTQGEIDKQMRALLAKKMAEKARSAHDHGKRKDDDDDGAVQELQAYPSTEAYPREMRPHQIFVDMEREAVILPIHGMHVPFHISTIKNVVQPEADQSAAYLRINFYSPGQTVGKDAPTIVTKLLQIHGQKCGFIKEMLFRSLDHKNLNNAFRLIQELRKRVRQRERMEKEEADLVEQEKLVISKNQKIPRLSDVIMRPHISGRKTVGYVEAHTNGLRFRSKKGEVVDVMYNNIRNAIFQPCLKETNVIMHFHLKDPIMINKKKTQDVQFYTEVVESMIDMEGTRRSTYDPDEIEEEQREREIKRRLNEAFKDFCQKVQAVAQTNDYNLDFDAPYKDLSFFGTPHREMVTVQFSAQCILNVSEMPFFVVPLDDIEHVHFERVTPASKNFDMVVILKDKEKDPLTVGSIPREFFIQIERTLLDVEVTFTYGPSSFRWKEVFAQTGRGEEHFYLDRDPDGDKKPAGWEFLLPSGVASDNSESEDDADSEFEVGSEEEEEEEEEEDESEFEEEEEEEDESDVDSEDEEAYKEADWEQQERRLVAEDKAKRGEEEETRKRPKGPPPRGRGPPPKKFKR